MTSHSKMAQKREFLPVGASARVGAYKYTPNARRDSRGILARAGGFSKNHGKSGRKGKRPLPRGNGGQVTNRPTPYQQTINNKGTKKNEMFIY